MGNGDFDNVRIGWRPSGPVVHVGAYEEWRNPFDPGGFHDAIESDTMTPEELFEREPVSISGHRWDELDKTRLWSMVQYQRARRRAIAANEARRKANG